MKTVLAHISHNSKNYLGILRALSQKSDSVKCVFTSLHGVIFDASEEVGPDYILLTLNEYTQEFHDFLSQTNKNVILCIDGMPPGNTDDVIKFLAHKKNITFLSNISLEQFSIDNLITYDKLYDDNVFYLKGNTTKNNKIGIMLSRDNIVNDKIKNLLYPNVNTKQIVCLNNPGFNHVTNLGILTDSDLAEILNTFDAIIDLDDQFELEAAACSCNVYDNDTIADKLELMVFKKFSGDLAKHTFKYFVNDKLLPLLGA